jgi:hypothetical protein
MRTWGIRILIVAVIAVGAFVLRDRLSGNAGDLAVGDCFDRPITETETIEDVQHHPCTEAHTAELIFLANHPAANGAPPPTEDELFSYVEANCLPAFNTYTGTDLIAESVFDLGFIYPLDEDWNKGDREISCYAYRLDNAPMTTSIKKAP